MAMPGGRVARAWPISGLAVFNDGNDDSDGVSRFIREV